MKYTLRFSEVLFGLVLSVTILKGQDKESLKKDNFSVAELNPMYMMTYDHGGLVLWGTDHFVKYIQSAVDWLNSYPGFKIGLDNEAYTYDFLSRNDTALLKQLKQYLRDYKGRFGIGTCTYGQPLSQFINEESNIRQIGYAIETDQAVFQYRPTVYLMSEHAMHSQIPQILKGFGFKGAIMRTHFMMYGYNPEFDSPTGWWTGRDGSRIAAIPTYKGEGSGFGWVTEDNLILTRYPGPECSEPLEEFRKKFSHIDPLLATRVDDSGLRQEDLVKEYEGNPAYKWILADELFDHFPAPKDEFRTDPDDFHVRMPWGYCGNEIWNMSRTAEVKILTAERIAALELLSGGSDHEKELRESWNNLLVGQHHDIQICGILEDSRRFLPASIHLSDSVINSSMSYFSSQMEGGNLGQITVFNPLSWPRNEWISISVSVPDDIKIFEIKDGNKIVPYEIVSTNHVKNKRMIRMDLSVLVEMNPLAIKSLAIVKSSRQQSAGSNLEFNREDLKITTPFWIIDLNHAGGISAITSRSTGRQILQDRRNGYLTGVVNGQQVESSGEWMIDSAIIRNDNLSLVETGKIGPIPYRTEMKLNSVSPRIDITVRLLLNEERIGRLSDNKREITSAFLHEEKLRYKLFPALGIGTTGVRDLPFTVAETRDNYIEGNYWTAIADGHAGTAVFNRGNMGTVRESDTGLSIPLAYSMYYVWKTVILKGNYTYEFSVYPFEGRWENTNLHKMALEYSFPCISLYSARGSGIAGNQIQLFNIKSDNVILSALYTVGRKPLMRFYESHGETGQLDLQYLNKNNAEFEEADLTGNERTKCSLPVPFNPWQIKTLIVATF